MKNYIGIFKSQKGATAVFVAVVLAAIVGMVAFAIDIGYVAVSKNELQNAADAAALAATGYLGEAVYRNNRLLGRELTIDEQRIYMLKEAERNAIISAAITLPNTVANKKITILPEDVYINRWEGAVFSTNYWEDSPLQQPTAVRVIARRDNTAGADGPIKTFFAKILGADSVNVSADATAALTGLGVTTEDVTPLAISSVWFDPSGDFCEDEVKFYPTTDSCAGWHGFEHGHNASTIGSLLEGMYDDKDGDGDPDDPEDPTFTLTPDGEIDMMGGTTATLFAPFENAFQIFGYDVKEDPPGSGNWVPITDANGNPLSDATGTGEETPLDADPDTAGVQLFYWDDPRTAIDEGDPKKTLPEFLITKNKHEWPTLLVVYDNTEAGDVPGACGNPSGELPVVGYAPIVITEVVGQPTGVIRGHVTCGAIEAGRGSGGSYFGALGSIPQLVE